MNSAELAAAVLPRTRFRDGFATDEVDEVIDQCVTALRDLEQGRPTSLSADAIVVKQFRHVRFGEAYDADAVDDLLDRVVVRLRELQPAGSSSTPPPSPEAAAKAIARADRLMLWMRVLGIVAVVIGAAMVVWKLFGS